jgi:hypothetical protein
MEAIQAPIRLTQEVARSRWLLDTLSGPTRSRESNPAESSVARQSVPAVRRWIQQQNRELSLAALDVCLGLEKTPDDGRIRPSHLMAGD